MAVKTFAADGTVTYGYSGGVDTLTDEQVAEQSAKLRAAGLCIDCTMPLKQDGSCPWNCLETDD